MAPNKTAELIREATLLKQLFPKGRAQLASGVLTWSGLLTPTSLSPSYLVKLRYDGKTLPIVRVVSPALIPDLDGQLPHIYSDGSLCLYLPGEWAWGDPLAKTVVPWACEWLVHYEIWRTTGIWHGSGGDHRGPIPVTEIARGGQKGKGRSRRNR